MKKLQRNFTTPDQSKRLLELGVPAWTADLYFYEEGCISNDDEPSGVIPYDEVYKDDSKETNFSSYVELPCWSVGRLIEIYCLATGIEYIKIGTSEISLIELMIKMIEIAVKVKIFDFSKLEE